MKKPQIHPDFGQKQRSAIRHPMPRQKIRDRTSYRPERLLCHNFDHIAARLFHAMQYDRVHISNIIDLHGMYVQTAEQKIKDQLALRRNRQLVFWKIIHGKGKHSPHYDPAPLKHYILSLLVNHSAVAALTALPDLDGKSGSAIIAVHPSDR